MKAIYNNYEQNDLFKTLVGKTIVNVEGLSKGSEQVNFLFLDGTAMTLRHYQDCCEEVELDDVCGDIEDLLNAKIYSIELVQSEENPRGKYDESYTWSFYKIKTSKGYVDLKWYGCSNGFYSEDVWVEFYTTDDITLIN